MSDVVTGEAVALDLRLARLASRSLALALDLLCQFAALGLLALVVLSGPSPLDSALEIALGLLIVVAVLVGYPVTAETLSRGRTLGKLALGLRVVRDDGGPIRFRHALVRGLAGFFVDFWALGLAGAVAVFVSLSSVKGKRVGDLLAGTVVVRERMPAGGTAAPLWMPAGYAGWAATLDLSRLPDGLALAVRSYLARRLDFNAGAADELAWRLAGDVSQHIGVPVPPGARPVDYLAAVLAERRAREQARVGLSGPAPWSVPPAQPAAPPPPPSSPDSNPFAPPV
ncbi:RDD family protein [Actinophytocola sp.]|uniref:RDD family protein n=1 Tax=Actinophytocola sp. TaxID=1872138 RepID=UPI002ED63642